ncbi:DNA/RNA helicase domain-containing protein [Paenibacillus sp. BR2-3]|uniref:DNA/RNA helicase domain-containing protein n=1 Tax=Paenibacillus sp. BR2-3 TaxID=3048494 RepID=UPI0039775377
MEQIGCVHTSQGLEFDYVGVIIGNDLNYDPERMQIYADYEEYKDTMGKRGLKKTEGLHRGTIKSDSGRSCAIILFFLRSIYDIDYWIYSSYYRLIHLVWSDARE